MRIPNSFVTRFTQASDLKLACVFYSLIHKNTKRNLLGYEITVKQTTLVSLCGFSVYTVKRAAQEWVYQVPEAPDKCSWKNWHIYIHY